jgi:lycopene cyclase domain-containing protein
MTYFGFLALFIGPPLVFLTLLNLRDHRKLFPASRSSIPGRMQAFRPISVVLAHVMVALLYTTPWDNYLVATGVWWYDPNLVTGTTLGWVPIEEYTFFIVQTLMTGLWLIWLIRRVVPDQGEIRSQPRLRWGLTLILGAFWLLSVVTLVCGWQPGTYLALILVWALPPIMLQTAFGADILWGYRSLVLPGFLVPTLYLSLADTFAIRTGTWSLDPVQTTGIHCPGGLPLEEFVFFLVTNLLISFGTTLVLARESQERVAPKTLEKIVKITGLRKTARTRETNQK